MAATSIKPHIKCANNLKKSLYAIDNGRFKDIINVLDVSDECATCDFFNLTIKNERHQHRCKCMSSCIAATLHPDVISYLNWKLEWISANKHLINVGIKTPQ